MIQGTLLITGGKGRLAAAVEPAFVAAGWDVVSFGHDRLDIADADDVAGALAAVRPDAVLNLAAWTDADACEADPPRAFAVNGTAVGRLADACRESGAHLCHVSSDYVFDGDQRRPYRESDLPRPLSVYGRSKLSGETLVGDDATVVRVAWLSGPHGRSFVRTVLERASIERASRERPSPGRAGAPTSRTHRLEYVTDQVGSPTSTHDVAAVLVALVAQRRAGLFHAASEGQASCYDLARHVLTTAGHDPDRVIAITTPDLRPRRAAVRPAYSVLDSGSLRSTGIDMPDWRDAIGQLVAAIEQDPLATAIGA